VRPKLSGAITSLIKAFRKGILHSTVQYRYPVPSPGYPRCLFTVYRYVLDARSFMISTLRSQVGFAAAFAHARLRLSRLELIGGSGRTAGRYASAARAFISPTAFEQARGGALGAGGQAGSGSLGVASSESAAGGGRLRACGS
jgi:hypothetical protein